MITRININGFKSLVNTELYFGPFTCIAGANAIGKSNFFDALSFLSNLADKTIIEAAKSVRSENQKHSNLRDIFFMSGAKYLDRMRFEVDLLIPRSGIDDLGQMAEATITSVRYVLELKLNENSEREPIEIIDEELLPITQTQTRASLYFAYGKEWISSVLYGRRSTKIPFISTDGEKIKLHQDGSKGRSTEFIAHKMPRTLLSTVTAESPTAFLVRQVMRNWTMLQLEPSALRQPNSIYEVKNARISANGLNLPATLFRLHTEKKDKDVYQTITNKLKGLVEDVAEISIDKDEKRDLLTLLVRFRGGLSFPAQSLSDGTLRFLGLAILEEDSAGSSLICLEEPENGINPKKIQEMIELLEEMAIDTNDAVGEDNPLRQVIINTHSPIVVSSVKDDCLYLAKSHQGFLKELNQKVSHTRFSALKDTWKTKKISSTEVTSLGEIATYLESTSMAVMHQNIAEPIENYGNDRLVDKIPTVAQNVAHQLKLNF